mgnify:CR=1 FL=1
MCLFCWPCNLCCDWLCRCGVRRHPRPSAPAGEGVATVAEGLSSVNTTATAYIVPIATTNSTDLSAYEARQQEIGNYNFTYLAQPFSVQVTTLAAAGCDS